MTYFDEPTILLMGRDGYERFVSVRLPFPPDYAIPVRRCMTVTPDDALRYAPVDRRTFRPCNLVSAEHRWWRVYNEGRSKTPEPVPVYLEQA